MDDSAVESSQIARSTSETVEKLQQKLSRFGIGKNHSLLNKISKEQIQNVSMRLHLGSKLEWINSSANQHSNITTKSSLLLSKLENRYRQLEKIAKKNRNGNIRMDESEFEKLIFCDYRGKDYGPEGIGKPRKKLGYLKNQVQDQNSSPEILKRFDKVKGLASRYQREKKLKTLDLRKLGDIGFRDPNDKGFGFDKSRLVEYKLAKLEKK